MANFSAYYAAVTIVTTAAATTSVAATFNNSSIPFVQFRFDIAIHFYNTFEQKTLNRMPNRAQYTKKRPNSSKLNKNLMHKNNNYNKEKKGKKTVFITLIFRWLFILSVHD